jgi:hypothetical protein
MVKAQKSSSIMGKLDRKAASAGLSKPGSIGFELPPKAGNFTGNAAIVASIVSIDLQRNRQKLSLRSLARA